MRHVVVARSTLVAAGLLAAAAVAFALSVQDRVDAGGSARTAPDIPGEALFAQLCACCHAADALLAAFPESAAVAGREVPDVREFLAEHGPADAAQDRAIVEFLWTEIGRRADGGGAPTDGTAPSPGK